MLKGTKVNLRLMRESDIEDFTRLSQDVEARGQFFPLEISSVSTVRRRFQEDGYWSDSIRLMLIVDKDTDRMLGHVAAFKGVFYQDTLEFGYILFDTARRGEGIMAEAVLLYADYIFRWKNLFRIQLQIETDNVPSRRTAEKAGFTHEGTIRQCLISRGVARDMEMYSLLRSEWEAREDQIHA
jgi:RimJ/RimL family protein N-acetyltransferase